MSTVKDIVERIQTQDNRCTEHPLFIVQQRRRFYGVDQNYSDNECWIHTAGECEEASEEEAARLYETQAQDGDVEGWELVRYVDHWEFVTACFTEQGCQDYIDANRHRFDSVRIYAASAHRNEEVIAVKKFLLSQGAEQ